MFTGIIQAVGEIASYDKNAFVLYVACPLFEQEKNRIQGKSIAIDGVCLTVNHLDKKRPTIIGFDLGEETQKKTLLTRLKMGTRVNVEKALSMGDPLDGHLVQGHVDGIAKIVMQREVPLGRVLRLNLDDSLLDVMVPKGSVAVNGVSLTINEVGNNYFDVCLIPHTLSHTGFLWNREGDLLHLESDIVGRYLFHFFKRFDQKIGEPLGAMEI